MLETIDVSLFVNPISADFPQGESVRYQGNYDEIRALKHPSVEEDQKTRIEWDKISLICQDLLEHKTKDMMIAVWLMESWCHLYQMKGLSKGLDVIYQLSEKYWDVLYPKIENGDFGFRLAPYVWMNEKLSDILFEFFITKPKNTEYQKFALGNYIDAVALDRLLKRAENKAPLILEEAERANKPDLKGYILSVSQTSKDFFQALIEDCNLVLAKIESLNALLDQKFPANEAPSFHVLIENVQMIKDRALNALTPQEDELLMATPVIPEKPVMSKNMQKSESLFSGGIGSRQQAYEQLEKIYDYLVANEPHSPTPYLIKRAMQWGGLNFGELFQDMAQNGLDINAMSKLLGFGGVDPKKK